MKRDVSAYLDIEVHDPTSLEFQIAVARLPGVALTESISFELDGRAIAAREITGPHGSRIHVFDTGAGTLRTRYIASVSGTAVAEPVSDYDLALYLRPSRYAQSDRLYGFAATEFGCGIGDPEMPARVSAWVGRRIRYVSGSSGPSDGAAETLLSSSGVCRDFTHLVVALLRAVGVPARAASVYAPGCDPMDFHSVVEAHVEGAWRVFDPTGLAPRSSLVRIATGRDAADIAFLDNHGGQVTITSLSITAVVDGQLPIDDGVAPTAIH